ncbi:MAG TPA: hypothetical protein IAB01_04495 [Candidatus Avidesulfovibrio excrementigallinarum]|nr:hypothetical protein [Candidatus Avidesulfovibrio excrementigallinarum]
MRNVLLSFAVALLVTAWGCCSASSIPARVPTLPVLASLQRVTLDGTPGVWMDESDAGRLAVWVYDLTGEGGNAAGNAVSDSAGNGRTVSGNNASGTPANSHAVR